MYPVSMYVCVMDPVVPLKSCTRHSAWRPLHGRSHSNFTRSANQIGGLGKEEVGRVSGLGGGGRLSDAACEDTNRDMHINLHIRRVLALHVFRVYNQQLITNLMQIIINIRLSSLF